MIFTNLFNKRRDDDVEIEKVQVEKVEVGKVYVIKELGDRLDTIECKLDQLLTKVDKMATTLDQVLVSVTEQDTIIDSVETLLQGIKKQLDEVLSGTVIPPAVQAKVDAIFATAEKNKAQLEKALLENTPTEPTA